MEIHVKVLPSNMTLVKLDGSLDISGATRIETELRGTVRQDRDVVVDLAGVTFISSQGVRVLVATAKTANLKGLKLVLVGPNPSVGKVLSFMSIDTIIPIFDSLDAMKHESRT